MQEAQKFSSPATFPKYSINIDSVNQFRKQEYEFPMSSPNLGGLASLCVLCHCVWHRVILRTPPSRHSQLGWRPEKKDPASRLKGTRGRLPPGPQRRRGHSSNHFLLPSTFCYGGCCHKSLLDLPSLGVRPSQSLLCSTVLPLPSCFSLNAPTVSGC